MDKKSLRIVFMGTPDFAVESLKALVEGGYNIVGVITMPDKPIGRHHDTLSASAVKKYAVEQGLHILQPEKLKEPTFIEDLRALKADLQIVVAFRMLPEIVWNMPRLGTFNLHASLLPHYRGAAPINWAIINGEKETGITTFFLQHEIDTGKIIQQVRIPIHEKDNAESIHDQLMNLGAKLVVETVDNILMDNIQPIDQQTLLQDQEPKLAPKIFKDTCKINWNANTLQIYNFIRGLSPYPAAWCYLKHNDKQLVLKIYQTEKIIIQHNYPIGAIISDDKNELKIAVKDGFISLLDIQLAGKKRMNIKDFLNGFSINTTTQMVIS